MADWPAMPILVRVGAMVLIWAASRIHMAAAPAVVQRIEHLSWTRKARLVWALSRDTRVPLWTRGIVLLPAAYMASPIDLLPDFIPWVGRMDDALVFSLSMDLLTRVAPREVVAEHVERLTK